MTALRQMTPALIAGLSWSAMPTPSSPSPETKQMISWPLPVHLIPGAQFLAMMARPTPNYSASGHLCFDAPNGYIVAIERSYADMITQIF